MAGISDLSDPHAILGVEAGADEATLKRAWRRIAKETHPDLNPGDPEAAARFRRAQEAYEALTNPAADQPGRIRTEHRYPGLGPDPDWLEVVRWMAVSHMSQLRREVLPCYAGVGRGGPSVAFALQSGAPHGLVESRPEDRPPRWARLWMRWTLRKIELDVDPGRSLSPSPITLVRVGKRLRIVLFPRLLWRQGIRDEDVVRVLVRRSLDQAVAAALPLLWGIPQVAITAAAAREADARWWMSRLSWPIVYALVALFSAIMIISGYLSRYDQPLP